MAAAPQQAQGSAGIPICGGFDFLFLLVLLLPLLVIGVGLVLEFPPAPAREFAARGARSRPWSPVGFARVSAAARLCFGF
jgi:hypothetical protein